MYTYNFRTKRSTPRSLLLSNRVVQEIEGRINVKGCRTTDQARKKAKREIAR